MRCSALHIVTFLFSLGFCLSWLPHATAASQWRSDSETIGNLQCLDPNNNTWALR